MDNSGLVKRFDLSSPLKLFGLIFAVALIAGSATGYKLGHSSSTTAAPGMLTGSTSTGTAPTSAQADVSTFKDFAEGVIQNKPASKGGDYSEGAFTLVRQGADPVALTSSVVDLSQYIGKKVKVYGETQQAIQAGWLMDVGRVDVE